MVVLSIRVICALYAIALTISLLVPDPLAWLWGVMPEITPPGRGVHFCAFFLLAILCAASRLPWRATSLAVLLVLYALATESLQGLVDSRTVELADYGENLLGLAVGAGVWTVGCWAVSRRDGGPAGPANES